MYPFLKRYYGVPYKAPIPYWATFPYNFDDPPDQALTFRPLNDCGDQRKLEIKGTTELIDQCSTPILIFLHFYGIKRPRKKANVCSTKY